MGSFKSGLFLLAIILAILVEESTCQRRGVRRRRPVAEAAADEGGDSGEGEGSEELQNGRSGSRRLGPPLTRERALKEDNSKNDNSRGHGRQAHRGRGSHRGSAGFRGRPNDPGGFSKRPNRRPNRRPVVVYYYDDDYYYDYDEYNYYQDYKDYYEYESAASPLRAGNNKRQKNKQNQDKSGGGAGAGVLDGLDLSAGGVDTPAIIKMLWEQFLKEKEQSSRPREPQVDYECPPRDDVSYYEPDEEQCDKYFECNIKGELKEHLCPDGFVFDRTLLKCDYPVKVNCSTRPLLQEPQPSTNCSRANGFFPWPANMSCQNFWDCREGTAYKQTCPVGVIFDPGLNACATPDQSTRLECTHGEMNFLNFTCPAFTEESVLRFGNHERLPHPEDCQQYFSCLRYGAPRLATCPRKRVFNNGTGQCSDPSEVPGCETYWDERLKNAEDDYYYYY